MESAKKMLMCSWKLWSTIHDNTESNISILWTTCWFNHHCSHICNQDVCSCVACLIKWQDCHILLFKVCMLVYYFKAAAKLENHLNTILLDWYWTCWDTIPVRLARASKMPWMVGSSTVGPGEITLVTGKINNDKQFQSCHANWKSNPWLSSNWNDWSHSSHVTTPTNMFDLVSCSKWK